MASADPTVRKNQMLRIRPKPNRGSSSHCDCHNPSHNSRMLKSNSRLLTLNFGYPRHGVGDNYCLFKGFSARSFRTSDITGLVLPLTSVGPRLCGRSCLETLPASYERYCLSIHANSNNFKWRLSSGILRSRGILICPIPPTIGRAWRTLREVLFLKNSLSGCLPFEIGYLLKATVLDASSNIITGPIPKSLGCLFSLQILNLANNHLYGAIPESLCSLPHVYNITLSNNYFTRVGPQCRKLITAQRLHVQGNCLPGFRCQKTAAECATFFCKPRSCPRANTFNYVPCKLPTMAAVASVHDMVPPSPRSYAALERP
ncbi:hypothetical protein SDJN02_17273, partial [Cucurbita argyrosperma subsp. argyrosperma]